jgi:beta-galactosidase
LDDYYSGFPAVTRYSFGKGTSYYLGTSLEQAGLSWLVDRIIKEAGITTLKTIQDGVEMTRRSGGDHTWIFILNHSSDPVQVDLPDKGVDLVSGASISRYVHLEPGAVSIIQIETVAQKPHPEQA